MGWWRGFELGLIISGAKMIWGTTRWSLSWKLGNLSRRLEESLTFFCQHLCIFLFSILVSSAICLSQWMSACVLLGNWEIYHDGVTDLGWQGEDDFCHATSYFTTQLWNILPLVNNFVMLFSNLTFAITKKTDNFHLRACKFVRRARSDERRILNWQFKLFYKRFHL